LVWIFSRRSKLSKPPRRTRSHGEHKPVVSATGTRAEVTQRQFTAHSGPIPDPGTLAGYDKVLPGAAERILSMAERQQLARIENERRQLDADITHREDVLAAQRRAHLGIVVSDYIGQVFGFLLGAACVAGAVYAGLVQENPWVAAVFISLPAVGIIRAVRGMMQKETSKK